MVSSGPVGAPHGILEDHPVWRLVRVSRTPGGCQAFQIRSPQLRGRDCIGLYGVPEVEPAPETLVVLADVEAIAVEVAEAEHQRDRLPVK